MVAYGDFSINTSPKLDLFIWDYLGFGIGFGSRGTKFETKA